LLAVRALWVFPLSIAAQSRRGDGVSWRIPAVVSWAGARGVLPLAAALSIPLTTTDGSPLAGRTDVLLLTTAVIVITLLVQGFTLGPLVRRTGVATPHSAMRDERLTARSAMMQAALGHLEQLESLEAAPTAVIGQLRRVLQAQLQTIDRDSTDTFEPVLRQLRRDLIAVESAALTDLHHQGVIGEATRRELQRQLDLEDTSLDH
jgi:CPA1 family monovalent cation:H+ antiporter